MSVYCQPIKLLLSVLWLVILVLLLGVLSLVLLLGLLWVLSLVLHMDMHDIVRRRQAYCGNYPHNPVLLQIHVTHLNPVYNWARLILPELLQKPLLKVAAQLKFVYSFIFLLYFYSMFCKWASNCSSFATSICKYTKLNMFFIFAEYPDCSYYNDDLYSY